jgi:glycosyltransferase involved in cell wall biosynthesis
MDLLIDAVPEVLQKVATARFLLVGDGPDREALEARVRSRNLAQAVRFPGRAGFEAVPTWIGACDVCVVLHRPLRSYPGDSMKLWEYLACGRPVVASAGPGYGQAVEAFGAGLSAGLESPHEIAAALVRLLTDPGLRAGMGQKGRAAVVKEHTWAARAAQLEALLQRAIEA